MYSIIPLAAMIMLYSQAILGKPISAAIVDSGNDEIAMDSVAAIGDQPNPETTFQAPQDGKISTEKCPITIVCEKAQRSEEFLTHSTVCTTDRDQPICNPWLRPGYQVFGRHSYEDRSVDELTVIGPWFVGPQTYCPQDENVKDCAICADTYPSLECQQTDGDVY